LQCTILRDRKQQTLILQVDSKHKTGQLQMENLFAQSDCPEMAEVNPDLAGMFGDDAQAAMALRDQAETLKQQLNSGSLKFDQKQIDEFEKQAEQFRKTFKAEEFKMDPQQAEQMRKAAEALRDQLNAGTFKFDQKQLDDWKQQAEQFRKGFDLQDLQIAPC
jgi:hypothetical protein